MPKRTWPMLVFAALAFGLPQWTIVAFLPAAFLERWRIVGYALLAGHALGIAVGALGASYLCRSAPAGASLLAAAVGCLGLAASAANPAPELAAAKGPWLAATFAWAAAMLLAACLFGWALGRRALWRLVEDYLRAMPLRPRVSAERIAPGLARAVVAGLIAGMACVAAGLLVHNLVLYGPPGAPWASALGLVALSQGLAYLAGRAAGAQGWLAGGATGFAGALAAAVVVQAGAALAPPLVALLFAGGAAVVVAAGFLGQWGKQHAPTVE